MNGVVVLTPDPRDSDAMVVSIMSAVFNVYLQFHQCFNSYVAYIHGAGNMPTHAVVHREGAFKYSDFDLKAAFTAVECRLRWCFYVFVIYVCDTAIFIKTNE